MKILIINQYCNPKLIGGDYHNFITPMPPIGLAYILAVLEKKGYQVVFFDDHLNKGNNKTLLKLLLEEKPDLVGMSLMTSPVIYRTYEIVDILRKHLKSAKITLGNLHASVFAEELIKNNKADIIVYGEGEETICEIAHQISNNKTLKNIKGIFYKSSSSKIIKTPARPPINNLDNIPFPAWHLMPIKKYKFSAMASLPGKTISIMASRGCNYHCTFCSLFIQGKNRRCRSIKNICDEIEYMNNKYGLNSFVFLDPIWPANILEAKYFCKELIKRKLNKRIIWASETRLSLVNKKLLNLLYQAGCRKIMFGIESGSIDILKKINKKHNLNHTKNIIQYCADLGLNPTGFFILGTPQEKISDMLKTIKYALSLKLHFVKFSWFVPYPGTIIYNILKKQKLLNLKLINCWENYSVFPRKKTPPIYINKNDNINLNKIIKIQRLAYFRFYLRPRQLFYYIKNRLNIK